MDKHWIAVDDVGAVEKIILQSNRKPQLIFKHSTRCSVSSRAYRQLEEATGELYLHVDINYVDVIANREVSDRIADKLEVRHESPQLLFVWNNKVVRVESHWHIRHNRIVENSLGLINDDS